MWEKGNGFALLNTPKLNKEQDKAATVSLALVCRSIDQMPCNGSSRLFLEI